MELKQFRYFVFIIVVLGLFFVAMAGLPKTWSVLRSMGIGKPVGNNMLPGKLSATSAVLLANMPQNVLSYLYLLFNGLYTSMIAGTSSNFLRRILQIRF